MPAGLTGCAGSDADSALDESAGLDTGDSSGGAGSVDSGGCKLAVISGAEGGAAGFAAAAVGALAIRLTSAGNVGLGVVDVASGLAGGVVLRSGRGLGLGKSSSAAGALAVVEELLALVAPESFAEGAGDGEDAIGVAPDAVEFAELAFDAAADAEFLSAAFECFQ